MSDKPWARRPDETDKAYAAFCAYLELGSSRSIDKAAQRKYGKTTARLRWWMEWSRRHSWVERARAFDQHEWDAKLEARQDAIERGRQALIDEVVGAAKDLVDVARDRQECSMVRLRALVEVLDRSGIRAVKAVELSGPNGKPIATRDETPTEHELNSPEEALEVLQILVDCGALQDRTGNHKKELTKVNDSIRRDGKADHGS